MKELNINVSEITIWAFIAIWIAIDAWSAHDKREYRRDVLNHLDTNSACIDVSATD